MNKVLRKRLQKLNQPMRKFMRVNLRRKKPVGFGSIKKNRGIKHYRRKFMNVYRVNDVTNPDVNLPVDLLRLRIQSDLAEIRDELKAAHPHDAFAEFIDIWHKGFSLALRHPNPAQVIPPFVIDLEKILLETDFEIGVFEEGLSLLAKVVIGKAIDPDSLLYSERVANEIPPISSKKAPSSDVPDHIFEQMCRFNALKAQRIAEETDYIAENKILEERLSKLEEDFKEKFTRVTRDVKEKLEGTSKKIEECKAGHKELKEKGDRLADDYCDRIEALDQNIRKRLKDLKGRVKEIKIDDTEQRTILKEKVNQLKKEVSDLNAETNRLQDRISDTGKALSEVERANIQLQIDINNVRTELAKKKENYLNDILKTVAVVVVSIIAKIIIEPYLPGASVLLSKGTPCLGGTIYF